MQYSSPLHGELLDLVQRVNVLAKVYKDYLVTLTHIVIPALQPEKTMDLIQKLLVLPSFLSAQTPQQLEMLVAKPPVDDPHALPFRLLLDIREIQSVLKGVTQVQLFRILDNVPTDNTLRQQLDFLSNLQEVLMGWSCKNLVEYSNAIKMVPVHQQRSTILYWAPKIQHSVIKLVIELFQLPPQELESFKVWLDNLPYNRIVLFVNLLTMQEGLLEVYTRLTQTPTVGSKRSYIDSLDISESLSSLLIEPHSKSQRLNSSTDQLRRLVSPPPTESDFFLPGEGFFEETFGDFDFSSMDFSLQGSQDALPSSPGNIIPSPVARSPVPNSPLNFDDFDMECEPSLNASFDSSQFNSFDFMAPVPMTLDFPFPSPAPYLPYSMSLADSTSSVPTMTTTVPPPIQTQTSPLVMPGFIPMTPMPVGGGSAPITPMGYPMTPMPMTTMPMTPMGHTTPPTTPSSFSSSPKPALPSSTSKDYRLTITTQPPMQTVYQHHGGGASLHNLFVEASLIRSDELKELPKCLEGTRVVPLGTSLFTTFKKLKILATSQQQGTTFRIMFQLKRYEQSVFHTIPDVAVVSSPIEVYSHTYYLPNRRRNAAAPPPMVTECLPPMGTSQGGDRILLLGVNFVESDKLLVSFGDVRVKPTFHESNALICTAPPGTPGTAVILQVTNDGPHPKVTTLI